MSTVVVLAGGSPHAHDFAAVGAALAELVAAAGHDPVVIDHPDAAAASLDTGVAGLVVAGLWWPMAGAAYDAWRAEFGYSPPPATRAALEGFVTAGGGLLALHTAAICFSDWPGWGDIVGGSWCWGVSHHPPRGAVEVTVVGAGHPVVAGLPSRFALVDEVYGDLALRDGITVLAVAPRHDGDADQPVVWTHTHGRGRVAYSGFGHDVAAVVDPHHARLLDQGLRWVLGGS